MPLLVVIVAILVALVGLWAMARNATTVCVLEVTKGKMLVTRGGIAPRILSDLRDVVAKPKVSHATVRVTRAKDRAEVELRGDLTKAQKQQIRNVIGTVPLAKLQGLSGRKAKKR
jgi:hypothetical protein